jgi:hypothetical protein
MFSLNTSKLYANLSSPARWIIPAMVTSYQAINLLSLMTRDEKAIFPILFSKVAATVHSLWAASCQLTLLSDIVEFMSNETISADSKDMT